jgi:hypothetical protein
MCNPPLAVRAGDCGPSAPSRFLNKIEMISERIVHGVNLQYLGELGRLRVENDRSLLPSPSP